jgi:phenylacetate-CoA ligase
MYYKELKKSQYYSLSDLNKIQFSKFISILKDSYQNVEFYKDLYSSNGIRIDEIKSLTDIEKLPITTKTQLKSAYPTKSLHKKMKLKKTIIDSTSGSTGKPFVFALNWDKKDHVEALKIRNFEYTGYGYGRKYYSLWGFSPRSSFIAEIYHKYIERMHLLSALNLNDETKELYAKILMNEKHAYLEGYASALVILAKYMINKNYKAELVGVTSSAETLVPEHRFLLKEAFGNNIFNRYGTREFGDIAIECNEHNGLHINMESFIVEIVNENNERNKPGESGRIILTDLNNHVMPFIRYDTEDLGCILPTKCACGRESLLLEDPGGRIIDTIRTMDGRHLSVHFFTLKFEDYPIVDQFQVIQKDLTRLELNIVKNVNFSNKKFELLLSDIEKYCDPMIIQVNFVDKIETEQSGKMRIIKGMSNESL